MQIYEHIFIYAKQLMFFNKIDIEKCNVEKIGYIPADISVSF